MADAWVGYERIIIPGAEGISYTSGARKHVLHTMEGSSIEGAVSTYHRTKGVPHFSIDPVRKRSVQHVPLDRAATALANKAGGVETNRCGAIQTEITGFAAKGPERTEDELRYIGEHIGWVRACGGGYQLEPPSKPFMGSVAAGVNSPTRIGFAEWIAFNGVLGHQHVPENDHWDPGAIDIAKILHYAGGGPQEEDDVKVEDLMLTTPQGGVFLTNVFVNADGSTVGSHKAVHLQQNAVQTLAFLGVKIRAAQPFELDSMDISGYDADPSTGEVPPP